MGEGASGKELLGPQSLTKAGFSVDVFMCKECNKVMDGCDSKFFFICNISNSWFLGIYQQNNLVARNCLPHICLGKETSAELHPHRSFKEPLLSCSSPFPQLLQSTPGIHFLSPFPWEKESGIIRKSPYLWKTFHEASIYNDPER